MIPDFSAQDWQAAQAIRDHLAQGRTPQGIAELRALVEAFYAAIPPAQRQSRGITWVVQRLAGLLAASCADPQQVRQLAARLYQDLAQDDRLVGVAIFLMAEYGRTDPPGVFEFFNQAAASGDWVVREFAAAGFRKVLLPGRAAALPWLKQTAQSEQPDLRRFASETLRPVSDNRWLNKEPETSLEILRLLFREAHPYPRTSVGNNLSDLARRNPALIQAVVKELVESGDPNSYWIAYRACRNMIKHSPEQIMDLLGVDQYHYKDRNFYRRG